MASDAHGIIVYPEQDGILNERCAYVLVAIGRGSHEQGIRLVMPQWGANGSFSWPNGVTVTFYNRLVFVLRPIGYKERPRPALAAVTPESLGVPLTGMYVIALCSGPARTGDISAWASGVQLVHIDTCRDPLLDIYRTDVTGMLVKAGTDARCAGVMLSLDCRTWSTAHVLPDSRGEPGKPYRDSDNCLGLPGLEPHRQQRVDYANTCVMHGTQVAWAVTAHGGFCIAEAPACRRASFPDATPGCERTVHMCMCMYDHPGFRALAANRAAHTFVFDQCMSAEIAVALVPAAASTSLASVCVCHGLGSWIMQRRWVRTNLHPPPSM